MTTKFPKVLAAIERREKNRSEDLWALGEALIEECGPPSENQAHNGSLDLIAEVAEEIAERGYDYTITSLNRIRLAAHAFPSFRRRNEVTFWVHEDAGNPDTLNAAIEEADRRGVKVTANFMRGFLEMIKERRESDRRVANRDALDRYEKARKAAEASDTSEARGEVKKARQQVEATKVAPSPRKVPPTREEVTGGVAGEINSMRDMVQIDVCLSQAKVKLLEAGELWNKIGHQMSAAEIEGTLYEATEVLKEARKLVDEIAPEKKKAHLQVVGG